MNEEPSYPVEIDAPRPVEPTARHRRPLFVALGLLIVLAVGGAVLLVRWGDDPDADETLAAVQAAVDETSSFRFTFDGEARSRTGDEEAGTDTTERFSGSGEWSGSRWHVFVDSGFGAYESVIDGTTSYDRSAEDAEALGEELWVSYEYAPLSREDLVDELSVRGDDAELGAGEGFADDMAIAVAESLFFGGTGASMGLNSGLMVDPAGFLGAISDMAEPTIASGEGGVTTLAITITAADEFVEAFGAPIPDGHVELAVGPDDLPVALRFEASEGQSSTRTEIRFSDWNEPIEVPLPAEDQIDATPELDEEGLRATSVALVWPTTPPEGWELSVWTSDELGEEDLGGCEEIGLEWYEVLPPDASEEEWTDAGYLSLSLRAADCALEEDPTPFEPGIAGLPVRNGDIGLLEVQVGQTVVGVDTNLGEAELEPILASLTPVDAETLIAAAS